jgi:hypothetical protein
MGNLGININLECGQLRHTLAKFYDYSIFCNNSSSSGSYLVVYFFYQHGTTKTLNVHVVHKTQCPITKNFVSSQLPSVAVPSTCNFAHNVDIVNNES